MEIRGHVLLPAWIFGEWSVWGWRMFLGGFLRRDLVLVSGMKSREWTGLCEWERGLGYMEIEICDFFFLNIFYVEVTYFYN